jgi:glycosyltransferase involved in cell wall biosynthesis
VTEPLTPTVSVVIPAYNVAPYIAATLESVKAQTFASYEVIVVNDGSPDTDQLEVALEPYLKRLTYIKQQNRGPGGARNAGIVAASGEFVAFLDADDSWMPEYLANQLRAFREDPSIDLRYTNALLMGDSPLAGRTFMECAPSAGDVTVTKLLAGECAVITSCVVARRRAILAAGRFDESFYYAEDFDLWLRLAHSGHRIVYTDQVLARHRLHEASLTSNPVRLLQVQIEVYRKFDKSVTDSATQSLIHAQIARAQGRIDLETCKHEIVAGSYDAARASLGRANGYYKSVKLRVAQLLLRVAPSVVRFAYTRLAGFRKSSSV